jgi:hypothetical protein
MRHSCPVELIFGHEKICGAPSDLGQYIGSLGARPGRGKGGLPAAGAGFQAAMRDLSFLEPDILRERMNAGDGFRLVISRQPGK